MRIREEQVEAFRRPLLADFERRALAHVREHFAPESKKETDEQVVGRVRDCQLRAGKYRLTTEKQIMCFVDTTYLLGLSFDDGHAYPELLGLLKDPELDPTEKAGWLVGSAVALRNSARTEGRHHE